MNILHVRLIKLTHSLCVCCVFWWFLLFWACIAITVFPVIRRSQGCTLRFRPLSTRRRFAPTKSIYSAVFLPTAYDTRSLHPGNYLRAIRWKQAFSTIISTFFPFCQSLRLTDWTRPRKRIGLILSLPRVVRSNTYPIPTVTSRFNPLSWSTNRTARWRRHRYVTKTTDYRPK